MGSIALDRNQKRAAEISYLKQPENLKLPQDSSRLLLSLSLSLSRICIQKVTTLFFSLLFTYDNKDPLNLFSRNLLTNQIMQPAAKKIVPILNVKLKYIFINFWTVVKIVYFKNIYLKWRLNSFIALIERWSFHADKHHDQNIKRIRGQRTCKQETKIYSDLESVENVLLLIRKYKILFVRLVQQHGYSIEWSKVSHI